MNNFWHMQRSTFAIFHRTLSTWLVVFSPRAVCWVALASVSAAQPITTDHALRSGLLIVIYISTFFRPGLSLTPVIKRCETVRFRRLPLPLPTMIHNPQKGFLSWFHTFHWTKTRKHIEHSRSGNISIETRPCEDHVAEARAPGSPTRRYRIRFQHVSTVPWADDDAGRPNMPQEAWHLHSSLNFNSQRSELQRERFWSRPT